MAQFSRYYTYIEPLTKTPKSRAYAMFILSLFALTFFGIFAIRPTITTVVGLQKEIAQSKEIDAKLSQKSAALQLAQEKLDTLGSKRPLLQQALPTTPNITQLLRIFESTATQNKVSLGTIQVRSLSLNGEEARVSASSSSTLAATTTNVEETVADKAGANTPTKTPPPVEKSVTSIQFTFTANGQLQDIENFVHQLLQMRRLITIESVRLATREKESGYTAEIVAKAYQLP